MKFIPSLLLLILCITTNVLAQEIYVTASDTIAEYDTTYINSYSDWLTTRIYAKRKFNNLKLNEKQFADNNLKYKPNDNLNVGFGFNYRSFGLNLAFALPALNDDNEKYGTTKYFDAQANIYNRAIAANGFFQTYRGYYLANPEDLEPEFDTEGNYPQRADIRTFSVGLSFTYIFNNKKFSARAAFTQDEWQKKSAGSFLLGAYGLYTSVNADSGLVPLEYQYDFDEYTNFNTAMLFDIGPQAGYAHSIVYKKHWFLTVLVAAGIGLDVSSAKLIDYEGNEKWEENIGVSFKWQSRAAMGYNSEKTYIGLSYVNESFRTNYNNDKYVIFDLGHFRVNLVRRFNYQPKLLDKAMDFVFGRVKRVGKQQRLEQQPDLEEKP